MEDLGVEFGVNSGSIFNIEPGLTIGVAANFTNQAEINTTALIEITSPAGLGKKAMGTTLTSPEVKVSFDAPSDVVQWGRIYGGCTGGSLPVTLADSIHEFSVTLIGDYTGNQDWWNFSLRYANGRECK